AHLAWKPSIVKGATIHARRTPPVSTGTSGLAGHLAGRFPALPRTGDAGRLGVGAAAEALALTPIGPGARAGVRPAPARIPPFDVNGLDLLDQRSAHLRRQPG